MNPKFITSRELLEKVGTATEEKAKIPVTYRHLFVTSVLEFVPAHKLQDLLLDHDVDVSIRDVTEWLQTTRESLGLPSAGRGKPSDKLREAIQLWKEINGSPTMEQIDAGWEPAHTLGGEPFQQNKISSGYQGTLKQLRCQMACLEAAVNDDEANRLLDLYLSQIRR